MQFHIYYGEGKGKTTAALGQALRAWGWGERILFVQFLKDAGAASGELKAGKILGRRWRSMRSRLPCPVLSRPDREEKEKLRRATIKLFEGALEAIRSGRYGVVVFDESLVACKLGLLPVAEMKRLRREAEEAGVKLLVATGRWAAKTLIASADLVTELRAEKHHYEKGDTARKCIEY